MVVHVVRIPRPNVAQSVPVPSGTTVAAVLRLLQIPPDAVVVIRGEDPVPLDAPVSEGETLRVINVFSGG